MARGRPARPARQRARHSGPVAPKRGGRKEVLPPTAHGPAIGAAGDRHRQARQLPGRAPRAFAVGDPSPVEVPEQPRRELPPADPATRERAMKRFKPIRHAQRFLSAFGGISTALSAPSASASAADYRPVMTNRFAVWNEITGRRPRPPPESATGTGRFVQATAHHPESSHRPIRLAQVDSAVSRQSPPPRRSSEGLFTPTRTPTRICPCHRPSGD